MSRKTQNGGTKKIDWHRYEEEKADIANAGLAADQYERAIKDIADRNGF